MEFLRHNWLKMLEGAFAFFVWLQVKNYMFSPPEGVAQDLPPLSEEVKHLYSYSKQAEAPVE